MHKNYILNAQVLIFIRDELVKRRTDNLYLIRQLFIKNVFGLAVSLVMGILFYSPVTAQESSPSWYENLECEKNQEFRGLEYCFLKAEKAHIIIVDLKSPGIRFEYIIARGEDRDDNEGPCMDVNIPRYSSGNGCHTKNNENMFPIMSITNAASYAGSPTVVIDSDYGAKTDSQGHGPEGFTVISGERIDGPTVGDFDLPNSKDPNTNNAVQRPWLAISQYPPLQAMINQIPVGEDDGEKYLEWIYTGVGGGPWIIKKGKEIKSVKELCAMTFPGSCYDGASQTSVGISEDRRWLFIVLVLDDSANLDTTRKILRDKLNVWEAMKFDGGGSSQLWYAGKQGDKIIEDGDRRWLSQYLAVYADKGQGIDFELEPPSEEPKQPSQQPGMIDSILNWWRNTTVYRSYQQVIDFWNSVQKTIEDIQNLQENIQDPDWWEQQMANSLSQCCGTMLLPAGLIILGLSLSRRRLRMKT